LGQKDFSQGISIAAKKQPHEKIFKEIERQTQFRFIYSKEAIDQAHPVTIEVRNETIENVLKICFSNQPISYSIHIRNQASVFFRNFTMMNFFSMDKRSADC